jgi:site-specific DNA-methyltransferase (adenine-specific)/modification methylase
MIKLINGDCLEVMKSMPSNSINLIVTSPPYNMNLRIRNGKYCSRQIVKELTTKYSNYSDNLPMDKYFEFNNLVLQECLRVSDLVFYNVQFLTGNKPALFKLIGQYSDKIKEFIVWDKCNAQPAIGHGVMNSQWEAVIVLQNSAPESRKFESANFNRGTLTNLWKIKRGKKISKEHGAVYPEELASTIINNFSKESSTILDPFMGTGTTGVVCKNFNRNFIGIELDKNYFNVAKERIGD